MDAPVCEEFPMRHIIQLLPLLVVSACATIMEGSGQSVAISTTPPGAICNVDRTGTHLASVTATPGSLRLEKSKNDLDVSCVKEGYGKSIVSVSPKFVGTTFGNIVAGGVIGVAIDAASGANYSYPSDIHLDLIAAPSETISSASGTPTVVRR
jgi:hypothetical protein